jgi:ABC-type oligopeptide transport system substrate-binding subunit
MSVPALDSLLDRISSTTDSPQRAKLVDEAERLTMLDAHIIPLYFVNDPELVSPRFTGVDLAPYGRLKLFKARPSSPPQP